MPSNQTFIVAAYVVTWVVILAYIVLLRRHGKRAHANLERVVPGKSGDQQ